MIRKFLLTITLSCCFGLSRAQEISTSGMQKMPGFINIFWDSKNGRIYLEIEKLDTEILYYPSLSTGIGSKELGLDRGTMSDGKIVKFQRIGNKVLLVEPNYAFRAISNDASERRAVEESFAQSVLWGFTVASDDKKKILVDATDFFIRDAVDAVKVLADGGQGNYKIEASRSAVYLPLTKSFPKNTEVEVIVTLTADVPGKDLAGIVPSPAIVTTRQHHSFVELPDNKYKPRVFDPRAGSFSISYFDYATPVSEAIDKKFIQRHRLEKKDPSSAVSEAVEPIVYYVDPGTPEPIRSALMDGVGWWKEAFEAAGYKDAFQVRLLPDSADPMDVRYNLVQWVHRSTRGWSYGNTIADPRTGEIIKGKVTLGSLRIRQDFLIGQGLIANFEDGKPVPPAIMEMCLQRMRQLAAHEVGHTLGFSHNYIASAKSRSSVMDYPYPMIKLNKDNSLDVSDAYAKGIGAWDKVATSLAYKIFPEGADDKAELDKMIKAYMASGLRFLTDQDADPNGGAHPYTHRWDNGTDAADELKRILEVRSVVLKGFGEQKIPLGTPMATLEEVLVPAYMMHRYQLAAASASLGGVDYTFALRGDGQQANKSVSATDQRHALDILLETIKPVNLALSPKLLDLIPPHPVGFAKNSNEVFNGYNGITFDPLAPAYAASQMTLDFVLYSTRAARLVTQHALDPTLPGLDEVIDKMIRATWKSSETSPYYQEIKRVVELSVLKKLVMLSTDTSTSFQARAIASLKLGELKKWLSDTAALAKSVDQQAHYKYALSMIKTFEQKPVIWSVPAGGGLPEGPPIGASFMDGSGKSYCGY